jgi:dihydroorotase
MKKYALFFIALFILGNSTKAQQNQAQQSTKPYGIIIKGGHVIDPKNNINEVMDVAITSPQGNQTARTNVPAIEGKIALVAKNIDENLGLKVINAKGLYVTPGLIDLHVHVFSGTNLKQEYMNGPSSVWPDGFTFRSGVTTVGDAGSSGWRSFPEFKKNIIDRSQTRVLAFLNIIGDGMGQYQQNVNDLDPNKAAEVAVANKKDVVGFKSAHFSGDPFIALDSAVKAGNIADMPIMLDLTYPSKPSISSVEDLFMKHLRPGDIFTHMYRLTFPFFYDHDQVSALAFAAQKRGIIFDVGHGAGAFNFSQAIPAFRQGFLPNVISTDLYNLSMNAAMKDMTNVMSKFLAIGMGLQDVVLRTTWNPAQVIKRTDLGHLSVGSEADIAVFNLKKGNFGFMDVRRTKISGTEKLEAELTIRAGRVVWDLNGISVPDWQMPAVTN